MPDTPMPAAAMARLTDELVRSAQLTAALTDGWTMRTEWAVEVDDPADPIECVDRADADATARQVDGWIVRRLVAVTAWQPL